ncbi:MAG: SPFH domain-containing protein [Phycisphaerales bacterium]
MKNARRWIIIGLVVLIVLAFMTTYTVKFTEQAIVTTFGAAASKPVEKPGLKFVVPYVQSVTKYDTRVRYMESKPETQQTKDSRQLVITAGVAWQISDPNTFYQKFSGRGDKASSHYKAAEDLLSAELRHAMSEIGQYNFSDLLTNTGQSHFDECEAKMLERLKSALTDRQGIEPLRVMIVGNEMPADTTNEVFQRMQQERSTLANKATSEGKAIAETIRQSATQAAAKIMAFANARAADIRAQGDREQAEFLKQLAQEPDLAIFLKNLDLLRSAFANNKATLVIPAGPNGGWTGMELFNPSAGAGLNSGWLPQWNFNQFNAKPAATPPEDPSAKKARLSPPGASDRVANQGDNR